MSDSLFNQLQPQRLTHIVDVGAYPIDGEPPYKPMLNAGICRLVGFEPQPEGLAQLRARAGKNEAYLPYIVGNDCRSTLYRCKAPGMTSLYKPSLNSLKLFRDFSEWGEVAEEESALYQKALDDIEEIEHIDFLKMDCQGGEFGVLDCGWSKLSECVVIQTEVAFVPLYHGQPPFGRLDTELRDMGFLPYTFTNIKHWPVGNAKTGRQMIDGDAIYLRDIRYLDRMTDEQLKHMALVMSYCYGADDIVQWCTDDLMRRGAIEGQAASVQR